MSSGVRTLIVVLVAGMPSAPVFAQTDKPVFDGLGMTLTKKIDTMTDQQICTLGIDQGPWKAVIAGPNQFLVVARNEKLLFAPDEQHLLRIGTDKPIPLTVVQNRNALAVSDRASAGAVVKAIVTGQEVKIRYFSFPEHAATDTQFKNSSVGFGYHQGVSACGWPSVGESATLAPAKISVYTSKENDGYQSVSIEGNPDLGLRKSADKYGGGCHISSGVETLFGMKAGQWVNDKVDLLGRSSVVIRDSAGQTVFSAKLPKNYNLRDPHGANPWPEGEAAARAAWNQDPLGTITLDPPDRFTKTTMLYGFRELWTWGVQNCRFTPVQ